MKKKSKYNIAIVGLGNIGSYLFNFLNKNKNNLSNKIYEAYNYYNKNCTDENFLNNYGKIINEFKYLKSMWK